jgi:hypothetical protein
MLEHTLQMIWRTASEGSWGVAHDDGNGGQGAWNLRRQTLQSPPTITAESPYTAFLCYFAARATGPAPRQRATPAYGTCLSQLMATRWYLWRRMLCQADLPHLNLK